MMNTDTENVRRRVPPDWQIVKMDERGFWNEHNAEAKEILSKTTALYGVWAFDRNSHIHICSLTPSYELWWLDAVYAEIEGLTDEQREMLDEQHTVAKFNDESVTYMNVSDVDRILKAHPERVKSVPAAYVDGEEKDEKVVNEIVEGWATGSLMF